jgi:hypothetical protein
MVNRVRPSAALEESVHNHERAPRLWLVAIGLGCTLWMHTLAFAGTEPGAWFLWAGQPGPAPRVRTGVLTEERQPVRGLVDGLGSTAQFNGPGNIAVDDAGNLYVLDQYDTVVRKISANGLVTTLARLPHTRSDLGSYVRAGIVIDDDGMLYVSEPELNRIVRISNEGTVSVYAGSTRAGLRNGPIASAFFSEPRGLALDESGNLYVADAGNSAIRRITIDGVVTTMAGGRPGFVDGPISKARFDGPSNLAIDKDGNIYVGEYLEVEDEGRGAYTGAIRRISAAGKVTTLCEDSYAEARKNRGALAHETFWDDCPGLGPYTVTASDTQGLLYSIGLDGFERIDPSKPYPHSTAASFSVPGDRQIPWGSAGGFAMDRQGNLYGTDPELAGIFKATPPYSRTLRWD